MPGQARVTAAMAVDWRKHPRSFRCRCAKCVESCGPLTKPLGKVWQAKYGESNKDLPTHHQRKEVTMNLLQLRSQHPHVKPYNLVSYLHHGRIRTGEVMSWPTPEGTAMVRAIPGHVGTLMELPLADIRKYSRVINVLKARVLLPWNNLGCLGFACGNFYADVFYRPYFGLYISDGWTKTWYKLPSLYQLRKEG